MKRTISLVIILSALFFTGAQNQESAGGGSPVGANENIRNESRFLSKNATAVSMDRGRRRFIIRAGQNSEINPDQYAPFDSVVLLPDTAKGYTHSLRQDFTIRFNEERPGRFRIERDTLYVEYEAQIDGNPRGKVTAHSISSVDDGERINIRLHATNQGVKETVTMARPDAASLPFKYRLATNLEISQDTGGNLCFGSGEHTVFMSPPPLAMDAAGKLVPLNTELAREGDEWFYAVSYDTAGIVYPLAIDPTIILWEGAGGYAGTRDTYIEKPFNYDNGLREFVFMGVYENSIARPLLRFEFPQEVDSQFIESAILTLRRYTSHLGTVRYGVHLLADRFYEGSSNGNPANGDESTWFFRHYSDSSWAKAGADSSGIDYYSFPVVFDTLTGLAMYDSFEIDLTPLVRKIAGVEKTLTNFGFIFRGLDTTGLYRLNWITSEHDSLKFRPRLSIVTRPALFIPYQAGCRGLSDSALVFTISDSSYARAGLALYDMDTVQVGDSIRIAGGGPVTVMDTIFYPGCGPNFPDTLLWGVYDGNGNIVFSPPVPGHTLAVLPDSARVDVISDSSVLFRLYDSRNPAGTEFAVFDSLTMRFRDGSGDTVSGAHWGVKTEWENLVLPVYLPNCFLPISAFVRNGDSVITEGAAADCTWVHARIPSMTHSAVIDSVRLLVRISPVGNPWYTFLAVQDSISGRFIDVTNGTLRSQTVTRDSAWAFGRYSDWGNGAGRIVSVSPGTSYHFRAYAKDGM